MNSCVEMILSIRNIFTVLEIKIVDIFSLGLISFCQWLLIAILLLIIHEISHLFWFVVSGNIIIRFNIGVIDFVSEAKINIRFRWKNPFSGCCVTKVEKNSKIVILGLLSGGFSGLGASIVAIIVGLNATGCHLRLFCFYLMCAGVISFIMTLALPMSQDHVALVRLLKRKEDE